MKMRVARHTANLQPLIHFYHNILGLDILASFEGHDGYDGVFLGLKEYDWHLEFTVNHEAPEHQPDDDDLLIFYPETEDAYLAIKQRFYQNKINAATAKNPYWQANGTTFTDPDGYCIVLACPRK